MEKVCFFWVNNLYKTKFSELPRYFYVLAYLVYSDYFNWFV